MKKNYHIFILLLILGIGLFLRIYDLGTESFWVDEGGTSTIVTNFDSFQILKHVIKDVHPPLYYLLLHQWFKLFGNSEFSLRFLSAIFGFLGIFAIYKLGELLFDKSVGRIAALMLALSLFHIKYSQEARMYSLLALLTLLSFYFFIKILKEKSKVNTVGYILSSSLLMYTHVFSFFIIGVQNIFVFTIFMLTKERGNINMKKWLFLEAILFSLFLPWLSILIKQVLRVREGFWIPRPTFSDLWENLITFAGSKELLFLFIMVLLISLLSNKRFLIKSPNIQKIYLLLLWFLIPVALPFLLSLFTPPIYQIKYTIAASLALYLLIAKGIDSINFKYVKLIVICIFIVFSFNNLIKYYLEINKGQWREVARFIDTNAKVDDLILFEAGFCKRDGFDIYSRRDELTKISVHKKTFAAWNKNNGKFEKIVKNYDKLWLILSHRVIKEGLLENKINKFYNLAWHKDFVGSEEDCLRLSAITSPGRIKVIPTIEVRLYERKGALARGWPDLSKPARSVGGGEGDAAVVVGVEDYAFVPDVPGAENNALAWYDYLTQTRKVRPENVALLRDSNGTLEEMREAARNAASLARKGGTLWFIFIGHGASSKDGKDGLLIGVDARQKAATLQTRSLRRGELLKILGKTRASAVHVVIDACFSGRSPEGTPLASGLQPLVTTVLAPPADPRFTVLTAAKGNQFAGALPGGFRPAFSYLVLGGLRGWADQNGDGKLTAGELLGYAKRALLATLQGRKQTPTLLGNADALVAPSARESAPDLAAMAKLEPRPGAGGEMFRISKLPSVPRVRMPQAFKRTVPVGQVWRVVYVDALEKYDAAIKFDKGKASGREKALKWRQLATEAPRFASEGASRAEEWERFTREQAAAARARRKRNAARDKDWKKLSRLLALGVVPAQDKMRWAGMFVKAYGSSPNDNPYMKTLSKYTSAVEWVTIPGGTFMMGSKSGSSDEKPVHRVTVKTFQMTKTEVTFGQYRECIKAGACTPPHVSDGKCYVWTGKTWKYGNLPASFQGKDQPAVCVDWEQTKAFSKWAGGRLPTEAEWEYAARSAGKDRKYPWGNEKATCDRAVMDDGGNGCGKNATWPVCSKSKGNTDQGLCDMAGNVWEWVEDWYHNSYKGAPTDGSAWVSPTGSYRVFRGGSWYFAARYVRAAARDRRAPGYRLDVGLGFRPVRSP